MNIIVNRIKEARYGIFNNIRNVGKMGRIALLCEQGRIAGVVKKGKTWLIPEEAEKPADKRRSDATAL